MIGLQWSQQYQDSNPESKYTKEEYTDDMILGKSLILVIHLYK